MLLRRTHQSAIQLSKRMLINNLHLYRAEVKAGIIVLEGMSHTWCTGSSRLVKHDQMSER